MNETNTHLQGIPILVSDTDNKQTNNVIAGRSRCLGTRVGSNENQSQRAWGAQSQAKEIVADGFYFK